MEEKREKVCSPRHHKELSTYFRKRSIGGCGKERRDERGGVWGEEEETIV